MLPETKKIKKLQKLQFPASKSNSHQKPLESKRRSDLATIVKPIKCKAQPYILLHSDVCLSFNNDRLEFDLTHLNQYKIIKTIVITSLIDEKILDITLDEIDNAKKLTTSETIDLFNNHSMDESKISLFIQSSLKFDFLLEKMTRLGKDMLLLQRILHLNRSRPSQIEIKDWLTQYPGFELKFKIKNAETRIASLRMNESFIREMGYSLDNFTTITLRDGIPRFFEEGSDISQTMLEVVMNALLLEDLDHTDNQGSLLIKSGYFKKIIYDLYSRTICTNEEFVVSVVFIVKKKSEPLNRSLEEVVTKEFLEYNKTFDNERQYLMEQYYGEKFYGIYSEADRVCKIRELD